MTPEQIKTWTITMPSGRVVPRTGADWRVEYKGVDMGTSYPTRAAAIDAYVEKAGNEGEDPSICMNCGS